jgi:small-conductance mechanosensitive channel
MVTLFGYPITLPPPLDSLDPTAATFILTGLAWIGICILAYLVLTYVLRAIARRLPGEVEDSLLAILRKPIMILVIAYGAVNTLETLPLQSGLIAFLERLLQTILILVVLFLLWRLIKDIVIYYGKGWAEKTESKIDDNLIPILNIFGPLAIIVVGVLMVLPMWGLDVSSALVGAGVIGLVLGLALQDSLSNLFSGMSLVVEAAYRSGDLLQLEDGSVCEVEEMGLRSTRMYSLDSHCTLYMPNKHLANMTIINITKPTVEQRDHIEFSLPNQTHMAEVEARLAQIAGSIPGVLMEDMGRKLELVQGHLREMEASLGGGVDGGAASGDPQRLALEEEIARYLGALPKLERERDFNQALVKFLSHLEALAFGLRERESQGFSAQEKQEIKQDFLKPTQEAYQALFATAEAWRRECDPYASVTENATVSQVWERRNERLETRWQELRGKMIKPDDPTEMRLDDMALSLCNWLRSEYRILPEAWKNPRVTFKSFDGDATVLNLWFYVDNIRLERDGRLQRVRTDIARRIREELKG